MPKVLSDAQITRFHDQGFLAPLDLMKETQTGHLDENFRTLEETYGGEVSERFRIKAHLPFPGLC